ncbi:hypothetical protein ACFWTE_28385 [Nocardiopsis sp. NPDC058631]|uniref:hypothetical protein n=1 Tax=Nocardiopsis sp. NPDC058631 TaxID=3346566 RepID=UPI0036486CBA
MASVVVVLTLFAGWLLWSNPAPPEPVQDPRTAEAATPAPSPVPAGTFGVQEGRDRVRDRYPVGFEHNPEGAVSAVVHELGALSTTDSPALAQALGVYRGTETSAASVDRGIQRQRAAELRHGRPAGTVFDSEAYPQPEAYYYMSPQGVWWEEVNADTVEVLVLADFEASDGAQVTTQMRMIYGRTMVWDQELRGGDWRVEEVTDPHSEPFYELREEEYHLEFEAWTPIHHPEAGDS